MPIQAPQWTEFLSCPVCCNEFDASFRSPISLGCGHTICKACLSNLHRKQCPFDQTTINIDIDCLPVNYALLQLVSKPQSIKGFNDIPNVVNNKVVSLENVNHYMKSKKCIEELALYLRSFSNGSSGGSSSHLTRPMQRKLVTLINCQLVEEEGRTRAMRAARSLGERTVTELILQHQNPQQLSANLWAAVRARGCQFLGPAMQEEVLRLVLLALEDGSALSRKVLVMFVVQRLEPHFSQASKTSIGHVVQLLYRASCFKVSKREGDSSLMQLKEEFRTYEALRREHDAQIVQIATEAGLRIAPDQWSALLYGDPGHKSHMQSIIDKLQTPQSFAQSVQELIMALQKTGDPGKLSVLRPHLELLTKIDPSPESTSSSWKDCREALEAVKIVVAGLVDFIQHHGSRKVQDVVHPHNTKYKISMCRNYNSCPRGTNCTFAHSADELERYRAKSRKSRHPGLGKDPLSLPSPSPQVPPMSVVVPSTIPLGTTDLQQPPPPPPPSSHPPPHVYPPTPTAPFLSPALAATVATGPPPPKSAAAMFGGNGSGGAEIVYGGLPPPEYAAYPPVGADVPMWEMGHHHHHHPKYPTGVPHPNAVPTKKTKSLSELQQRRQEVISQLEKVLGKHAALAIISNGAATLAKQDTVGLLDNAASVMPHSTAYVPSPFSVWAPPAPTFVRSDSILCGDDDDFPAPFIETPPAAKYGPISRMNTAVPVQKEPTNNGSNCGALPLDVSFYHASHHHQGLGGGGGYHVYGNHHGMAAQTPPPVPPPGVLESPTQLILQRRMPENPKELLAESQRVKMQLRNLERKINDLKLATQQQQTVSTMSEQDRLIQELQLIEQGICEMRKEATLEQMVSNLTSGCYNNNNNNSTDNANGNYACAPDEDTYEEGIAQDMRELELRLRTELEEQEKRWSSEEDELVGNQ